MKLEPFEIWWVRDGVYCAERVECGDVRMSDNGALILKGTGEEHLLRVFAPGVWTEVRKIEDET